MTTRAPKISVFTPSHDPRYLNEAYESLANQTFQDWEWVVFLNGKATTWNPPSDDHRVKVVRAKTRIKGVGAVKRAACAEASGDILVELDHDDRLTRACLASIVDAFRDPKVVFAYSDWAQINEDGSPNEDMFDLTNGWQFKKGTFEGQNLIRWNAMEPSPHNLGYIWYAPNHVRSFRRSAYEQVGGYDAALEFLDDQDLMIRLYPLGEFHRIERCLYLQRVHKKMTQVEPKINAGIQEQTVVNYRTHIESLMQVWTKRTGLRSLALRTPIWIGEDPNEDYEQVEIDPAAPSIAADDSSVGLILAYDILNRLPDRAAFFNEAYRVLVHGGMIITQTPSTDGRGAFQDPSSVAFYNENSFMYLTQEALRPAIPELTARLQVSHLGTYYQTPGHEALDIPYVSANLLAIKDGRRQGGPLLC